MGEVKGKPKGGVRATAMPSSKVEQMVDRDQFMDELAARSTPFVSKNKVVPMPPPELIAEIEKLYGPNALTFD